MEIAPQGSGYGDTRGPLRSCHCCGCVSRIEHLSSSQIARCPRCGARLRRPGGAGRADVATAGVTAVSLAALALFPSAVSLPIMRIEEMGHSSESSIWSGALALLCGGDLLVGTVVFLCSIVFPLLKLGGLIAITAGRAGLHRRARRVIWRLVHLTGRWGMLDVLLVAVVVAWVKVGDLVEIQPGPAAVSFTLVVLLSLAASVLFDPHALWDETPIPTDTNS